MPAPATAIETSDQNEITDGNENSVAPAAIAMAERPDGVPPFEQPADTAGIEVGDGLIAVSLAPSADGAGRSNRSTSRLGRRPCRRMPPYAWNAFWRR